MSSAPAIDLITEIVATDLEAADTESCRAVLHGLTRLIAWAEATKLAVADRLNALHAASAGVDPGQVVADATRVSLTQALQPFQRAETTKAMPMFGKALAGGDVSTAHIDVLTTALGKLDKPGRDRFVSREGFLADVAVRATPTEFARTVRAEVVRSQRGDGIDRLQQQKRATLLKTWVDQGTGMWCVKGEFDPETGARLHQRIISTVEKLFHDATPDTAPIDAMAKQDHLRALALVALVDGVGATAGGVDMTILIDAKTLVDGAHDGSVIDIGLPIDLPIDTIRRMACIADVTPVIVGADGVSLQMGLTTRLATRQQRRALRAMYRTCAVPGCCVGWDYLVIHHVKYYRNRGPTDIENLLPLCFKHHWCAHEGGWKLLLARDRTLTIVRPDGSTSIHGPPKALAA
jgi:hypothetical protein